MPVIDSATEALAWKLSSKVYETHRRRWAFHRAFTREVQANAVGIDAATIIILIQIAIQIWAWAKKNGYLALPASRPLECKLEYKGVGVPEGVDPRSFLAGLQASIDHNEDDDA